MRFSQGQWTFWRRGIAQKGLWNCTADKMVQRFKENGHLVFKSISALSRGMLKQEKGKTSIHFNGDFFEHRTLVPNNALCKSAPCLRSSGELVLSIREEKGRASNLVVNKILTKLRPEERSTILSISSDTSNWKQDARKGSELRRAGR